MIPFFLYPLLGFLTMEQIQAIFMQDVTKSYNKREVSQWVIDHIVNSEGFKENAYYATLVEKSRGQSTIGCGTSYLFTGTGARFLRNGSNKVLPNDTLTNLKNLMGYSSLSSEDFAVQLVKNYLIGDGVSSFMTLQEIEKRNVPYFDVVKEAILEFAYGSGSMHIILPKKVEFAIFIDALKTRDLSNIAHKYALMRYSYYVNNTVAGQWVKSDIGWMLRVYTCSMHIKGIEVNNPYRLINYDKSQNARNRRNIEAIFKRDLGLIIKMAG